MQQNENSFYCTHLKKSAESPGKLFTSIVKKWPMILFSQTTNHRQYRGNAFFGAQWCLYRKQWTHHKSLSLVLNSVRTITDSSDEKQIETHFRSTHISAYPAWMQSHTQDPVCLEVHCQASGDHVQRTLIQGK